MAERHLLALPGGYSLYFFHPLGSLVFTDRALLPGASPEGANMRIRIRCHPTSVPEGPDKNEAPGSPELLHRGGYMINEFNDNIYFLKIYVNSRGLKLS